MIELYYAQQQKKSNYVNFLFFFCLNYMYFLSATILFEWDKTIINKKNIFNI